MASFLLSLYMCLSVSPTLYPPFCSFSFLLTVTWMAVALFDTLLYNGSGCVRMGVLEKERERERKPPVQTEVFPGPPSLSACLSLLRRHGYTGFDPRCCGSKTVPISAQLQRLLVVSLCLSALNQPCARHSALNRAHVERRALLPQLRNLFVHAFIHLAFAFPDEGHDVQFRLLLPWQQIPAPPGKIPTHS